MTRAKTIEEFVKEVKLPSKEDLADLHSRRLDRYVRLNSLGFEDPSEEHQWAKSFFFKEFLFDDPRD